LYGPVLVRYQSIDQNEMLLDVADWNLIVRATVVIELWIPRNEYNSVLALYRQEKPKPLIIVPERSSLPRPGFDWRILSELLGAEAISLLRTHDGLSGRRP